MSSILRSLTPVNPAPRDYVVPPFPGLYWPFPLRSGRASYLYHATDIWRFTVLWTLLFYGAVHLSAAGYAMIIGRKNWKVIWIVPVVYVLIGGTEAVIAGSIVGGLIGGVYNAGYFRMSTWIPFVWALINTLVLILSSFAIQGGL
ncbi:integral membrane protein [Venturia nashicola]|uniref:Integral membrane protein n=1 Tax=Venturia nashicola TaxID=86259 RepID=A0A4Z1NJ51_9PEZI|nr:integral membrane protein [Venturia nashicola]TLD20833.1 integral membrane protein [Venturia nashicola]